MTDNEEVTIFQFAYNSRLDQVIAAQSKGGHCEVRPVFPVSVFDPAIALEGQELRIYIHVDSDQDIPVHVTIKRAT